MLKTTESLAKTTEFMSGHDILSDALSDLRISGNTLINDEYALPWAIAVPNASVLSELLDVPANIRVVAFHLVKRGYLEIELDGDRLALEAGEVAICFGGVSHTLSQGENAPIYPVEHFLNAKDNPFSALNTPAYRPTALTCGVFLLQNTELNPLFIALPKFLCLSLNQFPNLHRFTEILIQEIDSESQGRNFIIARLLEILCAEAVRSYAQTMVNQGWFGGLHDPIVKQAMILMHSHLEADWTVQRLAESVMLSPSRFAARFGAAIGESPMLYLTQCRMNLASRLLKQTNESVEAIAQRTGYSSLPAFNRTFKKYLGSPPSTWRHNKSLHPTL